MTDTLNKENKLLEVLKEEFKLLSGKVKRSRRVEVIIENEQIIPILLFAKERLNYIHFSHMSCVDWIEEGKFEIIYILWSPEEKINLLIKTKVAREDEDLPNIDFIWRQANTYEREIREMYGLPFDGLVGREEFILEDWDEIPPMRRDFITDEYVRETYFEREGREDAKDVREQILGRTDEKLPDFAKKYSRD
jgi:NADH-quinone oxidoreductase subunit C